MNRQARRSGKLAPPARLSRAELEALARCFSSGRHADMEQLAAQAVARAPADGEGWKALGIARLLQGKDPVAALTAARERLPRDIDVLSALGSALAGSADIAAAADCYRQALALRPEQAHLHANLADVRLRQGDAAGAEDSARQALHLQPALLAGRLNLARALLAQQRAEEASAAFEAALKAQPGHAAAWLWLGQARQAAGQGQRALDALREASRLNPRNADIAWRRGSVWLDLHRPTEAEAAWRETLTLDAGHVQAATHLSTLLMEQGRAAEALPLLQNACTSHPRLAALRVNLGNAWLALGRFDEAGPALRLAVDLAPHDASCRRSLAHLLRTQGDAGAALRELRAALAVEPDNLSLRSEALFVGQYLVQNQAMQARVLDEARSWASAAARLSAPRFTHWVNEPSTDRPLRVGLVSADLRTHPVAYFLESVLRAWRARAPVELMAYANQDHEDETTARLKAQCDGWRSVAGLDDDALCNLVRSDGIDVLVDLSGHTRGHRLAVFARKPAPVQVSWLGFFTTTGLDSFDAVLADPWLVPDGDATAFIEPVLRLPETALCFTPPDAADGPAPDALPSAGGVRFGCFNHLAKMGPEVVALWARVLQAAAGSTLTLRSAALHDPTVAEQVSAAFADRGVDPSRLLLQPASDRQDYLLAHRQVDIMLDPFPYPGGTTTAEALWMGVPVLTWPGSSPLSRQGQSLLMNVGLADWVASDADDYLHKALDHAARPQALVDLRRNLRQRLLRSPLCNADRFAGHLDAALRTLWQRYCAHMRVA